MAISTRLTTKLDLVHPVIQAPMALAAGGALASAVSNAGGLGVIGGAYGDGAWIEREWRIAGNTRIGCGFITWSLRKKPELLDLVLSHKPAAVFLSFDDPAPFAAQIKESGSILICQVQSLSDAKLALDRGADIIVAQGAEAGGHGEKRATMTIVPEVADMIAQRNSTALLCAAGGIADGRGLAASLMLGADGVVIGSRFWAANEALVHPNMHQAALAASGDDTIRSTVMDIARRLDWPKRFTARVLKNEFTERWHGAESALMAKADSEAARWKEAFAAGDVTTANTFVGEAAGLINAIEPAHVILERIVAEAETLLTRSARLVS